MAKKKNEKTVTEGTRVLVQIEGGCMMNDGRWHQAIRGTVQADDGETLILGDGADIYGDYSGSEVVQIPKHKIVTMQFCDQNNYSKAPEIYSYKA